MHPEGAGPKAYADFARTKIGETLKRKYPGLAIETGILVPNPNSADSVTPLAVVCQFSGNARAEQLDEVHRLAWNFSRTALLITLEPNRLIAWSCFRDPKQADERKVCELPTPPGFKATGTPGERSVRDLLHWVSLITGHLQRQKPEKFPADGRADALLLKNLKDVRRRLRNMNLDMSYCHDLLARVIFTQYLFHRQDSEGNAYFSPSLLQRRCDGALTKVHEDFGSILQDKKETYALFRWLDNRFNGDLFPGKEDQSDEEREAAWQAEKDAVHPEHLQELANLVSGKIDTTDRQLLLWPEYSFDTIPLEFISSVYEEFLNEDRDKNKAFYTPSHLVDYVLDAVLPWGGDQWNLRVLDPCCGSGIFLVKAFQRLIYRWQRVHGRPPLVSDLKPILAKNIMGVDINLEAVRVASFSLYLTMADAIEPKHYAAREKVFPRLRGTRLIQRDFFDESTPGINTQNDASSFDLVIGNAPWGDMSIKKTSDETMSNSSGKQKKAKTLTKAEDWARANDWQVPNNDIGPFFLIKALALVNDAGRVAMIQPAPVWLGHRAKPATSLRRKFFSSFTTEEITNLTAIRREIFNGVVGPACVIVSGRQRPTSESEIFFLSPKPSVKETTRTRSTKRKAVTLTIDPYDCARVPNDTAIHDPLVWSVLTLGGPRDLQLISRLRHLDTIQKLELDQSLITRLGVIPGDKEKPLDDEFANIPYFDATSFPEEVFLDLDASVIEPWGDPRIDGKGSTDFEAFKLPQLLIKQSYSAESSRFRSVLVNSTSPPWGTICKKTYLSVHDNAADSVHIRKACVVYNSRFAAYFLTLTSTRILFNQEILSEELTALPLPHGQVDLTGINNFGEIDRLVENLFSLSPAERILIDDLLEITLPDVIRTASGTARASTKRRGKSGGLDPELREYAQTIFRVLRSTFGSDKMIAATIYQEPDGHQLPVRMLTLHFDWPGRELITVESITADGLLDKLANLHRDILTRKARTANGEGFGFQRVAFLFHSHSTDHGKVRNLTIIKPDERRFWTRSLAMRDADELAGAIFKAAGWKGNSSPGCGGLSTTCAALTCCVLTLNSRSTSWNAI